MAKFKFNTDPDKQKRQYYDSSFLDDSESVDTSLIEKNTWIVHVVSQNEIAFSSMIDPKGVQPLIILVVRSANIGATSKLRPGLQIRGSGLAEMIETADYIRIDDMLTNERHNHYTFELRSNQGDEQQ